MEIFKNYSNYKKYEPEYASWSEAQKQREAKRLAYLEKKPPTEQEKLEAAQRGRALLNAIDIMDEHSQSKAEDTEIVADAAVSSIRQLIYPVGILICTLLMHKLPIAKKAMEKLVPPSYHIEVPIFLGLLLTCVASIPLVSWATTAQIWASRRGRFDAMREDLDNPNHFAVLNPEQMKQAEETAKNIPVDEELEKQVQKANINHDPFEFVTTIMGLLKERDIYEKQRVEFDKKIDSNIAKFDAKLSEKEILEAKKDQQMLFNLVEKIDIASQDYAENVELATNVASMIAISSGLGVGVAVSKAIDFIFSKLKMQPKNSSGTLKAILTGFATFLPASILSVYSTKLQKQGSRIGRFNVKQELASDVNNFVYVDDEKIKNMEDVPLEKTDQPNIFKFLIQAIKDNEKYQEYLKTQAIENKKFNKAVEEVKLSPEQAKAAKMLQLNTFRTFNEVDEKSQTYSESVEGVGEVVQKTLGSICQYIGVGVGMAVGFGKILKGKANMHDMDKMVLKVMAGLLSGLVPSILFEIYITKEQKKASRVANMVAIKDLEDYRHFADYSDPSPAAEQNAHSAPRPGLFKKFFRAC